MGVLLPWPYKNMFAKRVWNAGKIDGFATTKYFREFERSMISQRVRAGLSVVKEKLARDGKFTSRTGRVRRKLGRPGAEPDKIERARRELAKGTGIGTVHKLKREIGAHADR
jgi:DNA invertase Pin-like site-specific DNA recombinase